MQVKNTIAVIVTAWMLAGCGGGGGGSTPPPASVTQTVTCPNGTSKTGTGATASAALDVATAQCAGPQLVSVTPSNSATGVPPDSFASLAVATDSTLDPSSLTATNVTLKAGTTSVAGTVSADGTKGFKFTPSAKLLYAQVYNFVANVKDTLGKSLAVSSTFTTASISCTAPLVPDSAGTSCVPPVCTAPAVWSGTSCEAPPAQTCTAPAVWTPGINACVYPMGVKVYLDAKTAPAGAVTNATYPGQTQSGLLPPECKNHGDACWQEAMKNGTVNCVQTGIIVQQTGRPITFCSYKTVSTSLLPGQMVWCDKWFYADDGSRVLNNEMVENECHSSQESVVYHMGNALGMIDYLKNVETQVSTYYQITYDQATGNFGAQPVPAP